MYKRQVFPLANRVSDGKVTVLAQARGEEYTPYTTAQATSDTAANDYNWDETGIPEQYDFSFAWITDTQYYACLLYTSSLSSFIFFSEI